MLNGMQMLENGFDFETGNFMLSALSPVFMN